MQLVLVQSLKDEFKFKEVTMKPEVPSVAGTHLHPNGPKLGGAEQTKYHSGVYIVISHEVVAPRNCKQCA